MLRILFRLVAIIFGASVILSCSIKEDRTPCPCIADVYFQGCCHEPLSAYFLTGSDYRLDKLFTDIGLDSLGRRALHEVKISRTDRLLVACSGVVHNKLNEMSVIVPPGFEMDSLSSACAHIDAMRECLSESLSLNKQYCCMTVVLKDAEAYYSGLVLGNVCGFDLVNELPIEGDFHFVSDGFPFSCNVPRQLDSSLALQILNGNGDPKDMVRIGEMLEHMGYDWNAESLADCTVVIDFVEMQVIVTVKDWENRTLGNFAI